jgi:hypothetical protein
MIKVKDFATIQLTREQVEILHNAQYEIYGRYDFDIDNEFMTRMTMIFGVPVRIKWDPKKD